MPVKPSDPEEEYFARQEMELRRKHAEEARAKLAQEEKEKQRALHFMRCPKCGMELEEIAFGDIHVDQCFNCGGLWLDKGELETIRSKDAGFVNRLLNVFRG